MEGKLTVIFTGKLGLATGIHQQELRFIKFQSAIGKQTAPHWFTNLLQSVNSRSNTIFTLILFSCFSIVLTINSFGYAYQFETGGSKTFQLLRENE